MQKKLKKWEIYTKFIFGSKQPKKLWNTSATPFVKFPMNFRPVTLKKELSDFSKIPWPRICKKTQKMRNLYKIFLARNNLKSFEIRPQHHCWSFWWISSWYFSKKNLVIFQKFHDPGYAKILKKWEIYTKFFLARNNLKSFEIRPQHHWWSFWWISGP